MTPSVEEPWSPEPELREPVPRRVRPSEFPDLTAPNTVVYMAMGVLLLLAGGGALYIGLNQKNSLFQYLGGAGLLLGVLALFLPGVRAAKARSRAERLVQYGTPIMARIVTAANLTGDSTHGRLVTYMVTLPGGEIARRDVAADERALPKRIPGNVTALLDLKNRRDVELYCALPLRAIPRPAPTRDPLADLPLATPGGIPARGPSLSDLPDIPMTTPAASVQAAQAAQSAASAPAPSGSAQDLLPDIPMDLAAASPAAAANGEAPPADAPAAQETEQAAPEVKPEEKKEPAKPQSGYLPWE